MARKNSLFAGGRRSISTKIIRANAHANNLKVDCSEEAFTERGDIFRGMPGTDLIGEVPIFEGGRHGTCSYDLTGIVARFPHHEPLIRQLLTGIPLIKNGVSRKSASLPYSSICDFVEFLNDPQNLSNTPVSVVSDITVTVGRAFSTYLISRFPGRPANAKRFSTLRNLVMGLQKEIPHDLSIGPVFDWPLGPRTIVNPRQGYAPQCIGELVGVCQRDIVETMRIHTIYKTARDGQPIQLMELSLPNLMFYLRERLGKVRETSTADFIRRLVDGTQNARNLILREGYTIEEVAALYETRGKELARAGRYPSESEEDWTIENFMVWVRRKLRGSLQGFRSTSGLIKKFITSSPSLEHFINENGYSIDDIIALYSTHGEEIANRGRNPFGHHFDRRVIGESAERQLKLIIATLAQQYPDYPFGMSKEAASEFLSWERYYQLSGDENLSLERQLLRAVQTTRLDFSGSTFSGVNLVRVAMHFMQETLYPFFLHVQINTGWNVESILALTDNVDAHVTDDLIDPEKTVIDSPWLITA